MTKLMIPPRVIERLRLYVAEVPGEISGLGTIDIIDGLFVIGEVYLLKQTASQTTTELDSDAIAELLMNMATEGKDTGRIKLWWHSHGNMKPFWSAQDEQTCRAMSASWMVALVTNKAGESLARVELSHPVRLSVPIEVETQKEVNEELVREVRAEIKAKVQHPKSQYLPLQRNKLRKGIMGWIPAEWEIGGV